MTGISYHGVVTKLQAFGVSASGPFARPEWFTLLAEHGAATPFIHENDSAAFALAHNTNGVTALANWYSFAWYPAGDRNGWVGLAQSLRGFTHKVDLSPLANEDGTATLLEQAFHKTGWSTTLAQCDVNHVLEVKERSYAAYLSDRPGQLRSTIKRKAKRVDCRIIQSFNQDMWQSYEKIYQESWKPEEGLPAMLRAFAKQEGASGQLRLAIASHDGKPVAAQFWTVEAGTAYIHKLAHTSEGSSLSAGTVLTAVLMKHVIDTDGVEFVDFGTGDDAYKGDWMEVIRPRYRLLALDPRQPRAWSPIARQMMRRMVDRLASLRSDG